MTNAAAHECGWCNLPRTNGGHKDCDEEKEERWASQL